MHTDPIADMLTRIRNANKAMHESTTMPTSRMKEEIARLLKEEGYITDFRVEDGESFNTLTIQLKYGRNRDRVLTNLKRISKPGAAWTLVRIGCRVAGNGHRDPVDLGRPDHEQDRRRAWSRRRGRLLHLVSQ